MRAMGVTAYGRRLEPLDLPEPNVPPGHALVRVLTCGVCFTDVKIWNGSMPFSGSLALPHVPGHEVFGEVVETNPPGLVEEGARAIVYQYWSCGRCEACRGGVDALCSALAGWLGFANPGGFRERVVVPVDRLIRVPAALDPLHAAPMSCALGTAFRAVVTRGGVRRGTRVAVVGLGGVGIHAAQVGRAVGAGVIGFDVHDETINAAEELGLKVRHARDAEAVTAMGGVDVAIDTVGSEDSLRLVDGLLRRGGRAVLVGYSEGTSIPLSTVRVVLDEIELIGSRYSTREEIARAVDLVSEGRVRMVIGMVRPLEAVNDVFEALASGSLVGRAVLDVAGVA